MKAKLVTIQLTTRVIVNNDATEEDVIKESKGHFMDKIRNEEIHENVTEIKDDDMQITSDDLSKFNGCHCLVKPCKEDEEYFDNLQEFSGTLYTPVTGLQKNYTLVTVIDGNDDAFTLEVDSIHSIL